MMMVIVMVMMMVLVLLPLFLELVIKSTHALASDTNMLGASDSHSVFVVLCMHTLLPDSQDWL